MSEGVPNPKSEKIPPPRTMRNHLALLFHTDVGGEKELVQKLNAAWDMFTKKGDVGPLKEMYLEWNSPAHIRKKVQPSEAATIDREERARAREKASLEHITRRLKEESQVIFDQIRTKSYLKNFRNATSPVINPERILRIIYKNLCFSKGLEQNEDFIMEFLYGEGWITEENYKEYLATKNKVT